VNPAPWNKTLTLLFYCIVKQLEIQLTRELEKLTLFLPSSALDQLEL
jgi:hypothetical protein